MERQWFQCETRYSTIHHSLGADTNNVNRWDSSDPDRAPPPLPLNPGSPVQASRPNTSHAIQSAHAALSERARESNLLLGPSLKPKEEGSPERPLLKSAAHKRMQSLQTGHVRDLSKFIEGGLSPTKSPEKPTPSVTPKKDSEEDMWRSRSPEKDNSNSTTPNGTPLKDNLNVRPSLRKPHQSILGENAPPQSATMLALQSMSSRDSMQSKESDNALADITNGSNALVRQPQTFDAISGQILSLTSIATSLQREMAQLNRRSKDNATDLLSLKEATNARDEDIRKSLRELATNLTRPGANSPYAIRGGERDAYFLDDKPHTPIPMKTLGLPRPSPTSFAASLDRGMTGTPGSVYAAAVPDNTSHQATIALVEKVLREMGTKEGQDLLTDRLHELANRLVRENADTKNKMEELIDFVKLNGERNNMVMTKNAGYRGSRDFSFAQAPILHQDSALGLNESEAGLSRSKSADIINDDALRLIKSLKDSVAQGGGLTAEVKALVRELRGEVLGMGREIGRKLEQTSAAATTNNAKNSAAESENIVRIVDDGLNELKEHFNQITKESGRQFVEAAAARQIDGQEIYNAVKSAIGDVPADLSKEDVMEAVRVAWESYKPEIDVQNYALDREEILTTLKEGIQEYMPRDNEREVGATREEVFVAVVEGLKHFSPPQIEPPPSLSKDEILDAVRECLEEFEFPAAPAPMAQDLDLMHDEMLDAVKEGLETFDFEALRQVELDHGLTREDMLTAVREGLKDIDFPQPQIEPPRYELSREDVLEAVTTGLATFEFPMQQAQRNELTRELGESFNKDDVYDAVRAGLTNLPPPSEGFATEVQDRLQEILEVMHAEFKAVSDEAKDNVAAHGRDTEQVLDATKDGFEKLRNDIEMYVDRAADVTGKDEIMHAMKENFDVLRADIDLLVSQGSDISLEAVRQELETLRESITNQVVPAGPSVDNDALLRTIRDGLEDIRDDMENPKMSAESVMSGTGEILDALADGLDGLRNDVEKLVSKPVDMTVSYEILDTLRAGMEGLRQDIDKLREDRMSDNASQQGLGVGDMAAITTGAAVAANSLKHDDIEKLETLISQLHTKVESLENMAPPTPVAVPGAVTRDDLTVIGESVSKVQDSLAELARSKDVDAASTVQRDDIEAIETLLRNTKATIDGIDTTSGAKKEHIDAVEHIIQDVQGSLNELLSYVPETATKEDVANAESLIKDVMVMLQDVKDAQENDGNVAVVILSVKEQLEKMMSEDLTNMASKEDITAVSEQIKALKESDVLELATFQTEIAGVSESVGEVKTLLGEFRDAVKEKVESSSTGVSEIATVLAAFGTTLATGSVVSEEAKKLLEEVKKEFEESAATVAGVKLEHDEKFEQTWTKIDEKFSDLIIKYDDAQQAADAKTKAAEEQTEEITTTLAGSKELAEELKLLIDTLGSALTDSVEKMDEASKTVFGRVDDTFTKLEETHVDVKAEGQLIRDEVAKTLTAIEAVQGGVKETQPQIIESVKDVLMLVGEHFEHSKTSTEALERKLADHKESSDTTIQGLITNIPQPEKYDDGQVHEKLDKLVDHMAEAGKTFTQLEMLDGIHKKVVETASEVSQFVQAQTLRIANDHEDKVKEAEEAAILLERRLAEKERVEADIQTHREEAAKLKDSVAQLRAGQEQMAHQKIKLAADVSSLETALHIRREELAYMETRAEGLERRILEAVIDHSRSFMVSRTASRKDMSLKRAPSHRQPIPRELRDPSSASTASKATSSIASVRSRPKYTTAQSAMNIAMKAPRALVPAHVNDARRNFSLNMVGNSTPTGGFKRSHSVKEPTGAAALRKSSWGGNTRGAYGELGINDEKGSMAVKEEEVVDESDEVDDGVGDAGTLRRSSVGPKEVAGSVAGTEYTDDYSEYTETESGYTEYTETEAGETPQSEVAGANGLLMFTEPA